MTSKAELIKAVRDYALANYERDGWDYLVECWSDAEIEKIIGNAETPGSAIKRCREVVTEMDEYRSEVTAAGNW